MDPPRVLLTEASSLSAREHLTVLGRCGVHVEVVSSERFPFGKFSKWCHRVHPLPAASADPRGYLDGLAALISTGNYDALLATHEQAWLLAAGRNLLPRDTPMAIPSIEALNQVQGKLGACKTFDDLGLPQPEWRPLSQAPTGGFPLWLKTDYSTAGRGVRFVRDASEAKVAWNELSAHRHAVLAQTPAEGQYAQVAGVFDHGRMIGVHSTVSIGLGAGGSAAARLGVDHPIAREHLRHLGAGLSWHGGLTLDYVHSNGEPLFIECNPRTVEPGNAARSGVNLPLLTIAVIRGEANQATAVGRPGVRTRGLAALALGSAEATGRRRAVATTLVGAAMDPRSWLQEMLTPPDDWPSLVPLAAVSVRLLLDPEIAPRLTQRSVDAYGVTIESVSSLTGPAAAPA